MDFWGRAKQAFQNTYLNGIKKKLITIGIGIIVFIILITIILNLVSNDSDKNTDGSFTTIGKDYVVNTSISEPEIIVTDAELLKSAINSLSYSSEAKKNLIDNIPAFLGIQNDYNVNAVFAMAVTIVESSAGTSWAAIDSSTYNWCSMTAGSSWTGPTYRNPLSSNERTWRVYNSFSEATYDFGKVISNSTYYFGGKNYTVSSIAPAYCNAEWGEKVIENMTNIFEACGIDTSGYIDVSGSKILSTAAQIFSKVHSGHYVYGPSSIPCNSGVIDCSSFVDWVVYELGYNDFGGAQRNTEWWYKTLNPEAYGWTCFEIGDNDISVLQPGDIIVLNGNSDNKVTGAKNEYRHHMQIFVSARDATHANVYDCGGASNWSVTGPTKGDSTFWGYKKAKVIRITSNSTTNSSEE